MRRRLELTDTQKFENVCANMHTLIDLAIREGHPWSYRGAHLHVQVARIAAYAAQWAFKLHPELR